jgi:hypothetical protein
MLEKTIYLADYAKNQLETSDDASVWAEPIPYRDNPMSGFTYELRLGEEQLQYEPLEDGFFHPDRSEPDTILERLVKVAPKKPKRKKVMVKPGDTITMYLHGAGVTSKEKVIVAKVGKRYLHIETDGESPSKFNMATGKCMDDIDPACSFGFYRTIDKLL